MTDHAHNTRLAAVICWLLLAVSIASWPIGESGIGWPAAALAFLPLMLPLRGLLCGSRRTLSWAPLTLAPALALALTEFLVDVTARVRTGVSLALLFLAFASVIAALRSAPRDSQTRDSASHEA